MKLVAAPPVQYSLKKLNLLGLLALLFGVLGFVLWSVLTPLNSAVVAPGAVQVLSQNKQVQHLEGGIVEQIFVREDQTVKAGDVLLTLDETFAGSEHQRLVTQNYELLIREAVLLAERDFADDVVFPEVSLAHLDPVWLEDKKRSAKQLFELGRENLESQLSITDKRHSQLEEQARGLTSEREAKLDQLGFMEEEIASWKTMVEKKLANKLRFLEIQSDAAELRGVISKVVAQQAEVQVKISELELERLGIKQEYREKAARELRDIQYSIKDLNERLLAARNVLGRVAIRAPVDGKVVGLNVHTVGAVVKPGETVMEIVPDKDKLIIETRVNPTDVDQVHQGMQARIRISSYKRHELPELEGIIESISADVFQEERNQTQYYLARISISGFVPDGGTGLQEPTARMSAIQPGMPSEVMIITGESTPAQYLMDPLLYAFNRAWRDS